MDTRGRECDLMTPRLVSSSETSPEVMDVPRSAWTVCGTSPLRAMASAMNASASSALSWWETIQDGL